MLRLSTSTQKELNCYLCLIGKREILKMEENKALNFESKEVIEKINALIKSGVNPADIDYDEIVFQANLAKAKEFFNN